MTVTLVAGCNVGPKFKKPQTKVDAAFGGQKQGGYKSMETITDWWKKFDDPTLNKLISRALSNNLDLKIAAAANSERPDMV